MGRSNFEKKNDIKWYPVDPEVSIRNLKSNLNLIFVHRKVLTSVVTWVYYYYYNYYQKILLLLKLLLYEKVCTSPIIQPKYTRMHSLHLRDLRHAILIILLDLTWHDLFSHPPHDDDYDDDHHRHHLKKWTRR